MTLPHIHIVSRDVALVDTRQVLVFSEEFEIHVLVISIELSLLINIAVSCLVLD